MADQRDARKRDEDRVMERETGGEENPANLPGSRYGSAAPERPDLAPESEPVVRADVRAEDVPENVPGAMPENTGHDPADRPGGASRAPGKSGRTLGR